jgi:multimeric flavodoxin WrbA
MKVLAINSSPRGEGTSKTEMILSPLVEGMRQAGAQVEVINLRHKTIRGCAGCFTCWTKTPGRCIHQDDMTQEIFPKWLEADMAIYATPLYHYTMTASMKTLIERTLPVLEPFFEERNGQTYHPMRHKTPKAVVMSVAGFPEMKVFDQLANYVHFLFKQHLLAEIYRPGAESLGRMAGKAVRNEIMAALHRAGGELIHSQKVWPETLAQITQPLGIEATFAKVGNAIWRTCIAEAVTPQEMLARGIVPRPDSIETFMLIMPLGFRAEMAGDLTTTLQFEFSGDVQGACHFVITNGQMTAKAGVAGDPNLTIRTPFGLWMDIMTGKADGQQLFMTRKYQVAGDVSLLMRFGELFGK